MTADYLLPLKPIPITERTSVLYVEMGNRTHIPIGSMACLMLERL